MEQVENATREGYLKTDREFVALGVRDGSCVVTLAVTPTHLVAANAGDSRAVLAVSSSAPPEKGGAGGGHAL